MKKFHFTCSVFIIPFGWMAFFNCDELDIPAFDADGGAPEVETPSFSRKAVMASSIRTCGTLLYFGEK